VIDVSAEHPPTPPRTVLNHVGSTDGSTGRDLSPIGVATTEPGWVALEDWIVASLHEVLKRPRRLLSAVDRTALHARVAEHGEAAVRRVVEWFLRSPHDRAAFLREKHGLTTLLRPRKFEQYLDLADTPLPAEVRRRNATSLVGRDADADDVAAFEALEGGHHAAHG
jgi:hypothetical protein